MSIHYSTPKQAIEVLKGYEPDEPIIWDAVNFDDFADDSMYREDWDKVCTLIHNACDMLLDEHFIRDTINEVIESRHNRSKLYWE
jgi:hypothetical protein